MGIITERTLFIAEHSVILRDEASLIGIRLSEEQSRQLLTHLWMTLKANHFINLTAITDHSEALIKHIIDSLVFLTHYNSQTGKYLDMGTGAGYPGIVLEIMKPREGVLLDARAKKIEACQYFIKELGLHQVACLAERIEDHARSNPEAYGTVTARALAPLGVTLEYAQPLLAYGGCLITSKGHMDQEERTHGEEVAKRLGFQNVSRETLSLPGLAGQREVIVYKKVDDSEVKLPRKTGMATKRPL